MLIHNLTTNAVELALEHTFEAETLSWTGYIFTLAPGQSVDFGDPFPGQPGQTSVGYRWVGSTFEDSFEWTTGGAMLGGGDDAPNVSTFAGPPLTDNAGLYLTARFSLVILALLLGVTLTRVFQEGRKGGK